MPAIRKPRKVVTDRPMVLVMLDELPPEPTTVILCTIVGGVVVVETDLVAGTAIASNGRKWFAGPQEHPRALHDRAVAATRIVQET
jgi:hypothetical protein